MKGANVVFIFNLFNGITNIYQVGVRKPLREIPIS